MRSKRIDMLLRTLWSILTLIVIVSAGADDPLGVPRVGYEAYEAGIELSSVGRYEEAARLLWIAVVTADKAQGKYEVRAVTIKMIGFCA